MIAIWRTKGEERFQNYRAFFTILDTKDEKISRDWLNTLVNGKNMLKYAPKVWSGFIKDGVRGLQALIAPRLTRFRSKDEQLPRKKSDWDILIKVFKYFSQNRNALTAFEAFSAYILELSDDRYLPFDLTRPWRDGGRDALGYYKIGTRQDSIIVECSLEAKCFNPQNNSVGVKATSRLISRIRHRQFGIFVTTSWIASQAYKEIIEDHQPIIIVSGGDIVEILKSLDEFNRIGLSLFLNENFPLS